MRSNFDRLVPLVQFNRYHSELAKIKSHQNHSFLREVYELYHCVECFLDRKM